MASREIESNNPIVIILLLGVAAVSGAVGYMFARKRWKGRLEDLYEEFREKGELVDMAAIKNTKQNKRTQEIIKQELTKISNMIKDVEGTKELDKEKLKQEYQRVKSVLRSLAV